MLPFATVAVGPSCASAPSMPTYRWRPLRRDGGGFEREVLTHAVRRACRQERGRNGQVAAERPVERIPPNPRRDAVRGDALRRHDQLVAFRQREPFRVEAGRRVRCAAGRAQRRHARERDVAGVEMTVGDVDPQGVEPCGVERALVVGQAVEHAARLVVRDAREPADHGAGERRARRDDGLPEELKSRRLRAVARARTDDSCDCGHRDYRGGHAPPNSAHLEPPRRNVVIAGDLSGSGASRAAALG